MVSINSLPFEILEIIFSKLSFDEKKVLRLVNKQWLEVCSRAKLCRDEVVSLSFKDLHKFKTPRESMVLQVLEMPALQNCTVDNFRLKDDFWIKHGPSVRFLKVILRLLPLNWSIIHKIINYCPNILELTFEFVPKNYYFSGKFDSLNDIGYHHDSSDADIKEGAKLFGLEKLILIEKMPAAFLKSPEFSRLTQSVPNLKYFILPQTSIKEDSAVEVLKDIVEKQSLTLTDLSFDSCKFAADLFLSNAFELLGPQLTSLYFCEMELNSLECLKKHAGKFSNLKNLQLKYIDLTEDYSMSGFEHFKNLEAISFADTCLSEGDLVPLARLQNLKGLDISSTQCTRNEILKFFVPRALPNLTALKMELLQSVTDVVLERILPNLPNLEYLDVTMCNITSRGVQKIVINCKKLTHLSIAGCRDVKSIIKPASINGLPDLVDLNLTYCLGLDPTDIPKLRLSKLKTLRLGNVYFCKKWLKTLLEHCPKVRRVHLYDDLGSDRGREDYESDVVTFGDSEPGKSIFDFFRNLM